MKYTKSIKDSKIFQRTINKGNWYGSDFLSMYVKKNNLDKNYIGLAISKKAGKAFRRNRLKRLIRESYRKYEENLELGYNIVFMWKNKAEYEEVSYKRIEQDIYKMLVKAQILKEDK